MEQYFSLLIMLLVFVCLFAHGSQINRQNKY